MKTSKIWHSLVCIQGVRYLSACTMCRSTGITRWIERRNGSRYSEDFLSQVPVCLSSPTSSIPQQSSWWSGSRRCGWSCLRNHVSTFVFDDVQQFSSRPTSEGLGLHSKSIWLSCTHVGSAARKWWIEYFYLIIGFGNSTTTTATWIEQREHSWQ